MLRTRFAALTVTLAAGTLAVAAIPTFTAQEPAKPTDQHKMLMRGVGEWEGTITMYMPGMEPTPIRATDHVEAFGPFWTTSHFESTIMGMPYAGKGSIGYDVNKSKFMGTWIDNSSSHLSVMEGEYDERKKAIVMRWEAPDMTGTVAPHRSETVQDGDTYTMTFFMGDGEGTKSMEISMKRKAAKPVEAGTDR